jgi:hypothetical protein
MVFPQSLQIVTAIFEKKPSLLFEKAHEHQAVKELLYKEAFVIALDARNLILNAFEDSTVGPKELLGDSLNIKGRTPLREPRFRVAGIVGEAQIPQIIFAQRVESCLAALPAKGCQNRSVGLLPPEVRKGETIIIARGADEEQVLKIPAWQA